MYRLLHLACGLMQTGHQLPGGFERSMRFLERFIAGRQKGRIEMPDRPVQILEDTQKQNGQGDQAEADHPQKSHNQRQFSAHSSFFR